MLERASTVIETLNTGFLPAEVSSVRQFRFEHAQAPSVSQLAAKRLNDILTNYSSGRFTSVPDGQARAEKQEQGSPTFLRPCMRLQISSLQSLIMNSKNVHVLRIRLSIFDNGGHQ